MSRRRWVLLVLALFCGLTAAAGLPAADAANTGRYGGQVYNFAPGGGQLYFYTEGSGYRLFISTGGCPNFQQVIPASSVTANNKFTSMSLNVQTSCGWVTVTWSADGLPKPYAVGVYRNATASGRVGATPISTGDPNTSGGGMSRGL